MESKYIPSAMDEMRYTLFITELAHCGVAMCSNLVDASTLKVLKARADKFLVDTALQRRAAISTDKS